MPTVLITNHALANRTGTEMYVREIAVALLQRGWSPIAYSLRLGDVAGALRRSSIPVIEDLSQLKTPPDLIHGHHHLDSMVAILTFPNTPAIHFCHGFLPWEEMAVLHPNIGCYVAVDQLCRERLIYEHGIPESNIEVFLNFVDLNTFVSRPPLPSRPRRALVFSNSVPRETGVGKAIAEACAARDIQVDFAGSKSRTATEKPGELLQQYDLVFAKARCALEAMAVGCAVVVSDLCGMGGMVTEENYPSYRPLNFGLRVLQTYPEPAPADVLKEIDRYCPDDAARVSRQVRAQVDLESYVDRLVQLYERVMRNHQPGSPDSAFRATAAYLKLIGSKIKDLSAANSRIVELRNQVETARNADRLAAELNQARSERDALQKRLSELKRLLEQK